MVAMSTRQQTDVKRLGMGGVNTMLQGQIKFLKCNLIIHVNLYTFRFWTVVRIETNGSGKYNITMHRNIKDNVRKS